MTTPKPRPYQLEAINSVLDYFKQGNKGHPLVVLPTGAGKTHVLGGLCQRIHKLYPKENVLVLSHVQEILSQDYKALLQYLPPEIVGLYSAGLNVRQVSQFTVASIQSVYSKDFFKDHRLVIVDEAHLIPESGEGRYRTFFSNNPDAKIVGLTATPYRLGLGMLTDGLFDKIVYNKDIQELIDAGYLCKLISKATTQQMNTRDIKITAGDFNLKDLAVKLDKTSITHLIIRELTPYVKERKSWLVFCIDIAHAEHVTEELNKVGVSAMCVHSQMVGDRTEIIKQFKAGRFQALVSVETLTTGFDAPNVDLIALMRPTMSPVLHVQMIGRGLRIMEGKQDCLVLDFAGNVARLGPINHVKAPTPGLKKGTGKAPTRTCPECSEIVHLSAKVCTACGFEFPVETKLLPYADSHDIIAKREQKTEYEVTQVYYYEHQKVNGKPSMKVSYICGAFGMRAFNEWIALEHEGFAQHNARHWWSRRSSIKPPLTVKEALTKTHTLRKPKAIIVDESGKYPVIKSFVWGDE